MQADCGDTMRGNVFQIAAIDSGAFPKRGSFSQKQQWQPINEEGVLLPEAQATKHDPSQTFAEKVGFSPCQFTDTHSKPRLTLNFSIPGSKFEEAFRRGSSRKGAFSAGQANWRQARSPSTLMFHFKTSRTPGLFGEGQASSIEKIASLRSQ